MPRRHQSARDASHLLLDFRQRIFGTSKIIVYSLGNQLNNDDIYMAR
jgi:hypothetical protein